MDEIELQIKFNRSEGMPVYQQALDIVRETLFRVGWFSDVKIKEQKPKSLFDFKGDGLWLGSTIVVLASDLDEATKLAKDILSQNQYDPESLYCSMKEPRCVDELRGESQVVYFDNGDY